MDPLEGVSLYHHSHSSHERQTPSENLEQEQRRPRSNSIERLVANQLAYLRQWDPKISSDPACRYVPLRGKLVWTYGLMWFCTSLMVACCIIGGSFAPFKQNPMLGPDGETLIRMGALRTPLIRRGQWWRLLWSPMLHAGWLHLVMNFVLWWRLGAIIEPDWGFIRTAFVFMVSAVSGSLVSSTLDPFSVSVGASGGIFGLMGGCLAYVIEYWHTIPRPKCIFYVVLFSLIVGIACGFMPYVDNYAHMGGSVGGVLAGFMTITQIQMGTKPPRTRRLSMSARATMTAQLRKASASLTRTNRVQQTNQATAEISHSASVDLKDSMQGVSDDSRVSEGTCDGTTRRLNALERQTTTECRETMGHTRQDSTRTQRQSQDGNARDSDLQHHHDLGILETIPLGLSSEQEEEDDEEARRNQEDGTDAYRLHVMGDRTVKTRNAFHARIPNQEKECPSTYHDDRRRSSCGSQSAVDSFETCQLDNGEQPLRVVDEPFIVSTGIPLAREDLGWTRDEKKRHSVKQTNTFRLKYQTSTEQQQQLEYRRRSASSASVSNPQPALRQLHCDPITASNLQDENHATANDSLMQTQDRTGVHRINAQRQPSGNSVENKNHTGFVSRESQQQQRLLVVHHPSLTADEPVMPLDPTQDDAADRSQAALPKTTETSSPSWSEEVWEAIVGRPREKELPHRRLAHRTSLRITKIDVVDDSFQWKSCTAWIVRSLAFLGLLGLWVPFVYLLFVCPACYDPPGQVIDIGKHRSTMKDPTSLHLPNTQSSIPRLLEGDCSKDERLSSNHDQTTSRAPASLLVHDAIGLNPPLSRAEFKQESDAKEEEEDPQLSRIDHHRRRHYDLPPPPVQDEMAIANFIESNWGLQD